MSAKNEEELEFISVAADDDNELNNYMDPSQQSESTGGIMGSWIFTQSKVSNFKCRLSTFQLCRVDWI